MPRLKPAPRAPEYSELREERFAGETKDCAVFAVAAATGCGYTTAYELLRKHGRKFNTGTPMEAIEGALGELGYLLRKWSYLEQQEKIASYPIKARHITSHHPHRLHACWKDEGTLMFRSSRHIMTIKDGINIDWSHENSLRIIWVYQVEKI